MSKNNRFYLQNLHQGYVGNCVVWWAKRGAGYTPKLDNAEIFSSEKADEIIAGAFDGKFKKWEASSVRANAELTVDIQKLRRISDESTT